MDLLSTRQNIQDILKKMGTLDVEQIERFFRNAPDAQNVLYYIKEMVAMRLCEYDATQDRVTWHTAPAMKPEAIARRILAFWVVAYFGFENIREVLPLHYPSQIFFITQDNKCYDLTVCTSEVEAKHAVIVRDTLKKKDDEDEVNHIAIVLNKEAGSKLMRVTNDRFDSFCVYDAQKMPTYYSE